MKTKPITRIVYWRKNLDQVATLLAPSEFVITNRGMAFKFVIKKGEVIDIYSASSKNVTWIRSTILIDRTYKANEEIKYEALLSSKKH